jgi:hypothetical protein
MRGLQRLEVRGQIGGRGETLPVFAEVPKRWSFYLCNLTSELQVQCLDD